MAKPVKSILKSSCEGDKQADSSKKRGIQFEDELGRDQAQIEEDRTKEHVLVKT